MTCPACKLECHSLWDTWRGFKFRFRLCPKCLNEEATKALKNMPEKKVL